MLNYLSLTLLFSSKLQPFGNNSRRNILGQSHFYNVQCFNLLRGKSQIDTFACRPRDTRFQESNHLQFKKRTIFFFFSFRNKGRITSCNFYIFLDNVRVLYIPLQIFNFFLIQKRKRLIFFLNYIAFNFNRFDNSNIKSQYSDSNFD